MTVLPVPDEDMLAQASAEAADAKDAFVVDLEGYEGPLHLLLDLARYDDRSQSSGGGRTFGRAHVAVTGVETLRKQPAKRYLHARQSLAVEIEVVYVDVSALVRPGYVGANHPGGCAAPSTRKRAPIATRCSRPAQARVCRRLRIRTGRESHRGA